MVLVVPVVPLRLPIRVLPRSRRCAVALVMLLTTLFAMFLDARNVSASAGGRSGFSGDPLRNGGAQCNVCHAPDGAEAPRIGLVGPDKIDAGATQNFYIVVSGGPGLTAGVNIAAENGVGSLQPLEEDLALHRGELTHTQPRAFAAGLATFAFQYTAPNYNTSQKLYYAGNSSNGALDLQGDAVASGVHELRIVNGFEDPPAAPAPPAAAGLRADLIATGLEHPVVITHARDARLFVAERRGRIRLVRQSGRVEPVPFLDISSRVDDSASERGLLGLAFHPNYASNGYFYVYYTRAAGSSTSHTRVSRFRVSANADIADAGSEHVLLEFVQPFSNHNGGDLHFGPDGYLYIASGDGGSGGDPFGNGQNTSSLLGKLLRIDVDSAATAGQRPDCDVSGNSHFAIPDGNAYADGKGGAGCDEIFALGLRNPWRFAFDRETGALWIGDVGQREIEEINYLPPQVAGGVNFGWNCYEGEQPFASDDCSLEYLRPVFSYFHSADPGGCSVTGGRVYRGIFSPVLHGQYFFSDFCESSVRVLGGPEDNFLHRVALPAGTLSGISTFGEDALGELYVAELQSGALYRLMPVLTPGDVDGDGDVDWNDILGIWFARGLQATPGDRRDVDNNGQIEQVDVGLAGVNCSRAQCAVE